MDIEEGRAADAALNVDPLPTDLPQPPSLRALDVALVGRLERGDEEALREAIRVLGPPVLGRAWRIVGDASLAEEIAQDVFVELWMRPSMFDPGRGSLSGLLLAVARNKSIDRIRHLERSRRRDNLSSQEQLLAQAGESGSDATADGVIRRDHVRAVLERLSPLQREMVVLVYFGGRTVREVAEELGVPEGTAKTRLRDGLIKLRQERGPS